MTVAERLLAIDAAWLGGVLRARDPGTASVEAVDVEAVAFAGATTDMARLRLTYRRDGAPGPPTLVAKAQGRREVQRRLDGALGLFAREARFYGELAHAVPVRSPACFHAGDGHTTPLLLEDLAGLRMGDQARGVRVDDAEALLDVLADLHAAFWKSPALDAPWLLRHDAGVYPQLVTQLVCSGVPALEERCAGVVADAILGKVVDAAPAWGDLLATAAQGPATLVHNDCRLDNAFFAADGTPCLIDWQVLSRTRGTQDVANLLAGSMDSDDLAGHWERLVTRYHERLMAQGVRGYGLEQCFAHYRQNVFFPLAAGIALLGAIDIGDGRGLGEIIVARCLRHIEAVDAFGAL